MRIRPLLGVKLRHQVSGPYVVTARDLRERTAETRNVSPGIGTDIVPEPPKVGVSGSWTGPRVIPAGSGHRIVGRGGKLGVLSGWCGFYG
jgi:hypothetical protein